jgi:hypothetical protein
MQTSSDWKENSSGRGSKNLNVSGVPWDLQSKKLRLDLRAVAFIDDQGKQLLQEIYRKTNASFVADSPLTHYFAHAAMQQKSYREKHGG